MLRQPGGRHKTLTTRTQWEAETTAPGFCRLQPDLVDWSDATLPDRPERCGAFQGGMGAGTISPAAGASARTPTQEHIMEFVTQLWIPIALSAAAVWFASFLIWAVLDIHKKDFARLPDEERFADALRSLNLPPGNYLFPWCESKAQQRDPAYLERVKQGPTGYISLWGRINMGRNMALTFITYLVVSVFIAYLGWAALGPGASFGRVFQITGTAGVLAYAFGFLSNDVWFGVSARSSLLKVMDGVA
jgi:hypothetical protein